MLFDRAVAWLITNKVLLPGATVLERQVVRIRSRAQARVWSLLVRGIFAETAAKLEALLRIPDGGHVSMLDRLRKGPFLRSAPGTNYGNSYITREGTGVEESIPAQKPSVYTFHIHPRDQSAARALSELSDREFTLLRMRSLSPLITFSAFLVCCGRNWRFTLVV